MAGTLPRAGGVRCTDSEAAPGAGCVSAGRPAGPIRHRYTTRLVASGFSMRLRPTPGLLPCLGRSDAVAAAVRNDG